MNRGFQWILLKLYAAAASTGLLSTAGGKAVFEWSYEKYKEYVEAGDIDALRAFVPPGTTVIDVGANIGFFTTRFGLWVGPAGKVIALEPELDNFGALTRALSRHGLESVVDALQGVAAEESGSLNLEINSSQPTDHKIGAHGILVKAFTLDEILEARGWPKVSLCKIDVQGAEERVLRGSVKMLERLHPALFVEVGDSCLRAMGSSAEKLFALLAGFGYRPYRLTKGRLSAPLTPAQALDACRGVAYQDFLFLTQEPPARP